MKAKGYKNRLLIQILALALVAGAQSAMAQSQQRPPMQPPDALAQLKEALQASGASALSSAQESAIQALIKEFREAHKKAPEASLQSERAAYDSAILSGDRAAIVTQAQIIANAQAAGLMQQEIDTAAFAINALNILKADATQYNALVAKLTENGLLRLVLNLAGGPGGGPRGGPGGPGGPGGFGGPGGRGGPGGSMPPKS
jgi:hypothetical protein